MHRDELHSEEHPAPAALKQAPPPPPRAWIARIVGRPWFWVLAITLLTGWPIVRSVLRSPPEAPPLLGQVMDFTLTDQYGRDYGPELRGRAWVAQAMCTGCPTINPAWTKQVELIQHRARQLGAAFHEVSITVDPEHDQVADLKAFARRHRASALGWTFLTGPPQRVREVLRSIFGARAPDGTLEPTDSEYLAPERTRRLVLIDARGQIRGFYDPEDAGAVDRLLQDAGRVVNDYQRALRDAESAHRPSR